MKGHDILPRDEQQDSPIAYCEKCGGEIYLDSDCYFGGLTLCQDCYDEMMEIIDMELGGD